MSELDDVLANPDVEVVDSAGEFGQEEAVRVADGYNRAPAGIIRDGAGRVLLVRRSGSDWRLPGGNPDRVEDFEERLRERLRELLGVQSATVEPSHVHRHAATNREDVPPYHYVVYEVEPTEPPAPEIEESPRDDVEVGWFAERPDEVLNEDVMAHLFGDRPAEGI